MKLFALYPDVVLPNLEFNHRKYCDKHNIEYTKVTLSFSEGYESQKIARICEVLESNIDETCFFIDNYSYFQNFDIFPEIDRDIILQKYINGNLDLSFFIVKSNKKTIKTFVDFRKAVAVSQIEKKEISNNREYITESFLNCSDVQPFPVVAKKVNEVSYFLNGNITIKDLFNISNLLCINVKSSCEEKFVPFNSIYCAEYFCLAKQNKKKYKEHKEPFEIYNEGMSHALVTLYTKEVFSCGVISEENFKKYCKANHITLYVYREIPNVLENKKMSGGWCKPFILLKHMEDHKSIAWVDSDVIIGKKYKINFDEEISVYQDPGNWLFNSGFMVFKNTENNKNLLNGVIEEIRDANKDVSSTYVGGGDQALFIKYFQKIYGDKIPLTFFAGNTHPFFPYPIRPSERHNFLTHFMGLHFHVRTMLMKAFDLD